MLSEISAVSSLHCLKELSNLRSLSLSGNPLCQLAPAAELSESLQSLLPQLNQVDS